MKNYAVRCMQRDKKVMDALLFGFFCRYKVIRLFGWWNMGIIATGVGRWREGCVKSEIWGQIVSHLILIMPLFFLVLNSSAFYLCCTYLSTLQTRFFHGSKVQYAWVKVFMIIPEFRILRLTFHRKSASKCWIREIITAFLYFQSV